MKRLIDLSEEFSIKAPADGMVIYARGWEGKVEAGSRLRAWNPVVAELPDLTEMISKTYVNEVDISKVSIGQDAYVSVDAFPDARYTGTVQQVANIGEQLRNYDTKVFEVIVSVNEQDSILRPAMTTGIEVIISEYDSVNYIPLEALYKDSVNYVFKKAGGKIIKQEVVTGPSNDLDIIIAGGLQKGEEVLLTKPEKSDEMKINYFDGSEKKEILAALEKKEQERKSILEEKKSNLKNDIERKTKSAAPFVIIN